MAFAGFQASGFRGLGSGGLKWLWQSFGVQVFQGIFGIFA